MVVVVVVVVIGGFGVGLGLLGWLLAFYWVLFGTAPAVQRVAAVLGAKVRTGNRPLCPSRKSPP